MPFTTGTITCRGYRLVAEPPADFRAKMHADLRRHAFQPVNPERSPRSLGWVNPRDILDTDLRTEKIIFDDFLALGLRVDKVSVNAKILKAHCQQAISRIMKERDRKQLSRDERTVILEKTRIDLMKKQTPISSFYEMAWNLESNRVYFSATGGTLNTEFCDLFQETFHTGLTPLFPYLRAEDKAEKEGRLEALLRTQPARFFTAKAD
jgi:hypothetical protein